MYCGGPICHIRLIKWAQQLSVMLLLRLTLQNSSTNVNAFYTFKHIVYQCKRIKLLIGIKATSELFTSHYQGHILVQTGIYQVLVLRLCFSHLSLLTVHVGFRIGCMHKMILHHINKLSLCGKGFKLLAHKHISTNPLNVNCCLFQMKITESLPHGKCLVRIQTERLFLRQLC